MDYNGAVRALTAVPLAAASLALWGCDSDPRVVRSPDTGAETGSDAPVEDGRPPDVEQFDEPGEDVAACDLTGEPGPLTLVAADIVLTTERVCDLDGDSLEDNAIANLGSPGGDLLAGVLTDLIRGGMGVEGRQYITHFPWLDDATAPDDPEAIMLFLDATDTDDPVYLGDDLSGHEAFYADDNSLDFCGEPEYAFLATVIRQGALSADGGTSPVPFDKDLILRGVRATGSVGPCGAWAQTTYCGYLLISDLGDEPGGAAEGLTMLEFLVAGGAAAGIPTIPGVDPDLDFDGDGAERIILDDDLTVESCVDGSDVIDGRDCWTRLEDGFSIVMAADWVGARFAGREPEWESHGDCDSGPPDASLFDRPDGLGP